MKKEKETPTPQTPHPRQKKPTNNNSKTKPHQKLAVTNKLKKPSLKEYFFAKSPEFQAQDFTKMGHTGNLQRI